jgi:hypothetical protein
MAIYVSASRPTGEQVLIGAEYDAKVVAYAIVAGIILYFLKKSFINNFPYYVSIVLGLILTLYLYGFPALRFLGIALMADGFYKLIAEHITLSS